MRRAGAAILDDFKDLDPEGLAAAVYISMRGNDEFKIFP